jgi:hypothetical protein
MGEAVADQIACLLVTSVVVICRDRHRRRNGMNMVIDIASNNSQPLGVISWGIVITYNIFPSRSPFLLLVLPFSFAKRWPVLSTVDPSPASEPGVIVIRSG